MKTFTYLRYLLNVQSSLPRELRRRLVVAGSRVVVEVVIGADIHITFVRHVRRRERRRVGGSLAHTVPAQPPGRLCDADKASDRMRRGIGAVKVASTKLHGTTADDL
jgi:hypothetical protein